MGLLDLFGLDSTAGSAATAPAPAAPEQSFLQEYGLSPFGITGRTSDNLNSFVGALGQSLLTSPSNAPLSGVPYFMRQGQQDQEAQQRRAALKQILKQTNPSLTDQQLEDMAADPATAKLALSAAELQASQKAGQQASGMLGGLLGGATPPAPAGPAAGVSLNGGTQLPGALPAGANQDDVAIRTVLAEAGNQGTAGMQAVAGVLRNRALLAGTDLETEALKPNQFEPWNPGSGNDPRRFKPDSPEYQAAAAAVLPVLRGEQLDPTGGATHFYAPKAQAALGRPAPKWDDGSGVDLGDHRFLRLPYGGRSAADLARGASAPVRVADASAGSGGGAPLPSPLAVPRPPASSGAALVQVAETEQDVQRLEGRMGMYPPNVYGVAGNRQATADMPAPGAQDAAFVVPDPNGSGRTYGPDTTTGRALAARAANAAPAPPTGPSFALNDPAQATQAIPQLFKVLEIPNLPDAQRTQAKAMLDYALGVVKPTDRTRQLMEAGYAPGSAEYRQAYRELVSGNRAPSGYRATPDGAGLEAIPGGPADPANRATSRGPQITEQVEQRRQAAAGLGLQPESPGYQSFVLTGKMPREDAQPLTALDKKAIQEADTSVLSARSTVDMLGQAKTLSKQAYAGPFAEKRGYVTSMLGSEAGTATQDLDNLVTTQALQSLKSIFGGNPTEGERAILLEIQGSSSKPDVVRQRIYDRAIGLANLKMQQNQEKADELRGQSYYKPGGGTGRPRDAATSAEDQRGTRSGAVAAPPAAIDHLRSNPGLADAFDAKYGPGASSRALGGR